MADREEDEELQMALRMSLQGSPPAQPEPKRSKPPPPVPESPEAEARRKQRELMAAAAEKRLRATAVSVARSSPPPTPPQQPAVVEPPPVPEATEEVEAEPEPAGVSMEEMKEGEEEGEELPPDVAEKLWAMVFGGGVSKAVLAQWTNQGIRCVPLGLTLFSMPVSYCPVVCVDNLLVYVASIWLLGLVRLNLDQFVSVLMM